MRVAWKFCKRSRVVYRSLQRKLNSVLPLTGRFAEQIGGENTLRSQDVTVSGSQELAVRGSQDVAVPHKGTTTDLPPPSLFQHKDFLTPTVNFYPVNGYELFLRSFGV